MNVPCSNAPGALQLTSNVTRGDGDSVSYSWVTNCPNGAFDDASSASPVLTFQTYTEIGIPVSCSAILSVTYNGVAQTSCEASVSVSECPRDCYGTINGTATYDQCGVCNGDGTSCLCDNQSILSDVSSLETNFGTQCANIARVMARYKRSCGKAGAGRSAMQ